jgi:hypothetical protein
MPLYEVAILERPSKKEAEEEGAQEKLVFGPKPVVARDPQGAVVSAVLGSDLKINADKMQVLVRPFAS